MANALTKKIRLFTPSPTAEDVRNQVATEKLIQLLPFKAQAFVREREPKIVTEAADLASSYFYSHNMDEFHWELTTISTNLQTSKTASKKNNKITLISNIKAHFAHKQTHMSHGIPDLQQQQLTNQSSRQTNHTANQKCAK